MLIGDKSTIGYEVLGSEGQMVTLNLFIDSFNITWQDNSFYIFPLIKNIQNEIALFSKSDLTLSDNLQNKSLDKLYDIFHNAETRVYQSDAEDKWRGMDIFFYDLSTQKAFFYVYRDNDELVIFGKTWGAKKFLTTRLNKQQYIDNLIKLLNNVNLKNNFNM